MLQFQSVQFAIHWKFKTIHVEPAEMNSTENKYSEYGRAGKQVVFMDQTNHNLLCRRKKGRAKRGKRAKTLWSTVYLIGAISSHGPISVEQRRGSFTKVLAKEYVGRLIAQWVGMGNEDSDLFLIYDNAPCHSRIEEALVNTQVTGLRPNVWPAHKPYVKQ